MTDNAINSNAPLWLQQAFEKIQARQQEEIAYLINHHPSMMAKPEYAQELKNSSSISVKSLEARNAVLDKINSELIEAKIDINATRLYLDSAHITRLPVTLFQAEAYVNFWKNLTNLDCSNNQVTALNVQGLPALQELYCYNNQLTALNVQGLAALQCLYFNNNPLNDLNLAGVHASTKNKFAELEKTLLFKQLGQSDSGEVKQGIIARLGADYTYINCLKYCPVYVDQLFASELASLTLSQISTYLPSFGVNNDNPVNSERISPRDENQMRADQPEASDDEPVVKRRNK